MVVYERYEDKEKYLNNQLEDPDFKKRFSQTRNQLEHDVNLAGYGQDLTDEEQIATINKLNQDLQAIIKPLNNSTVIRYLLSYYNADSEFNASELAKLIYALNLDYLITNKETGATYLNSPCYGYVVYLNNITFWEKYLKQNKNLSDRLNGVWNYNQVDHYVRIDPTNNLVLTFNGLQEFYYDKKLYNLFDDHLIKSIHDFMKTSIKRQDVTKAELNLLVELKFKMLAVIKYEIFKNDNRNFYKYLQYRFKDMLQDWNNSYDTHRLTDMVKALVNYYYPEHLDQFRELLAFLRDEVPEENDNEPLIYKNIFTNPDNIDFSNKEVGKTVNYKGYVIHLAPSFNLDDPFIGFNNYSRKLYSYTSLSDKYYNEYYVDDIIRHRVIRKMEKFLNQIREGGQDAYKFNLTYFSYLKPVIKDVHRADDNY